MRQSSNHRQPSAGHRTSGPSNRRRNDRLTRTLGWASLGLGVPQLLRPASVTRAVGVGEGPKQRAVATAVGARELVHAAGLLSNRVPPGWVWTRVAGDAMDLTVLGRALRHHDGRGRARTKVAAAAVAGIAVVDVYAGVRSRRQKRKNTLELTATTTVRRDAADVYDYWRQLENLPSFMAHLEEVRVIDASRSHWRASAPFGKPIEWDAEIVDDQRGQRISWRSVDRPDVPNEGSVTFTPAPGGRGTEVHVSMSYTVPGGKLGEAVARYFGEDPHQQLDDDLRRFKQVLETGEVVRSDGAPHGKQARGEFPQHPAQPLSDDELTEIDEEEVRA